MADGKGTNTLLGGGGFHHVAVRVHDFDAALRFYNEALGFVEKVRWGEGEKQVALLDVGDGNYLEVCAGGPKEPPAGGAMTHFALRTSDVDAAIERVRAAGARVRVEPQDVTLQGRPFQLSVRIAFCKGPGGEEIEFFKNELT